MKKRTIREKITPKKALAWLSNNPNNRRLKTSLVHQITGAITRGEWQENGATIVICEDGTLLDGQNRLTAIVKADVAVYSLVTYGVPKDAYKTIDAGCARGPADVLKINGYEYETILSGAVKILMGRAFKRESLPQERLTGELVLKFLGRNTGVYSSVKKVGASPRVTGFYPSVIAACHFKFSKKDAVMADTWLHKVLTGEDMTKGDPVLVFRNRIIKVVNGLSSGDGNRWNFLVYCVRCWNAMREGSSSMRFTIRADENSVPEIK